MCIPFETLPPRTEEEKKQVDRLKFLAAASVVVAMIKMFVFKDIASGFYELLSCLILWMGWSQLSYCICLLYIVYVCILGSITYAVNLLTPVQNGMPFFGVTGLDHVVVFFTIVFLFYYIGAAYIAFQAYKEFKANQYEMNGGGNGLFSAPQRGGGQPIGGTQAASRNYGGSGGGDTEAYNQSSNNLNNQQQSSRDGQTYFQGRGVRIG